MTNLIFKKIINIILAISIIANNAIAVEVTYYHNDLLGSPVATSNKNGDVKWQEQYKPYGDRISKEAASASNEMWFTGKQHDDDTGLTYMNARYYDPVIGRFMATDPVSFVETNPMSFNRYAYANNNPYKYIDPDGRSVALVVEALIVFGLIVVLSTVAPDPGNQRAEANRAAANSISDAVSGIGSVFSDDSGETTVGDLDILHDDGTIGDRPDISGLSDDELLDSVMNPSDADDPGLVENDDGKLINGNTRARELKRRAKNPDSKINDKTKIPVTKRKSNNSDFFFDM
ncbi:Rhs-family protein [hydrothermal vent metagenome]|uniref:Rhs-family protein n=1 Tax=hydrothermal vent metagenome TaxID=652676 RepID=A0A3B0Y1T4_9ZZZZ